MEEKTGKPRRIKLGIESEALPDEKPAPRALTAKKDFLLHHNEYRRQIRTGDDLADVPELYHENLRTEGVL